MGFFDSVGRGIELTKLSLGIAAKEKQLLLLPILNGISMAVILLGLFGAGILGHFGTGYMYLAVAIAYFVSFFFMYFTQAMIVETARVRFEGKDPTFQDGFGGAMRHMDKLVLLAIIGAIVSVLVQAVRGNRNESNGFLRGLIAGILGASWTFISYFSIPVILNENTGVFDSFRRSGQLVRDRLGETLVANLGLGVLMFVGVAVAAVLGAAGFFLGGTPGLVLLAVAVLVFVAFIILNKVVQGIVSEALYYYAANGKLPEDMVAASPHLAMK